MSNLFFLFFFFRFLSLERRGDYCYLNLITDMDEKRVREVIDSDPVIVFPNLKAGNIVRDKQGESRHVGVGFDSEGRVQAVGMAGTCLFSFRIPLHLRPNETLMPSLPNLVPLRATPVSYLLLAAVLHYIPLSLPCV